MATIMGIAHAFGQGCLPVPCKGMAVWSCKMLGWSSLHIWMTKHNLTRAWAYFGKRHFGMDISSQELFVTRTFQQKNISARVFFCTIDGSARWRYSAGTFWHRGTHAKMSAPKCLYCFARSQNVHVLKYPWAKMSQCRDLYGAKEKCSRAEMSLCQKNPVMKCPCQKVSCWNVMCQNKLKP